MATAVRILAITLYFLRRNGDPIAVTADLAGDPIAALNPRVLAGEQSCSWQHDMVRLFGIIQVE